jgi:two-component system response regulator HydG
MRPRTLRYTLLLAIAVIVLVSGTLISQLVTHRYSVSLIEGAVAQAENVAHKLALDAAEQVLINDLLQRMLDGQIAANPAVSYIFIIRDVQVLSHTFQAGVPVELIAANAVMDSETGHLEKIVSDRGERFLDIAWPIFGGRAGMLRIGFSEEPYRKKVGELWFQMSLITLGILAVSLIAGQIFVFRLTAAASAGRSGREYRRRQPGSAARSKAGLKSAAWPPPSTACWSASRTTPTGCRPPTGTWKRRTRSSTAPSGSCAHRWPYPGKSQRCRRCAMSLYLINTFKSIIACRNMALLVFSSGKDNAFLTHEKGSSTLGAEAPNTLRVISGQAGVGFFERERLGGHPDAA